MENQIQLKQVPVIVHQLEVIGASVTNRINELNIENLIATDETIQFIKKTRAELNSESKDWELQRKAVKDAVFAPYSDFEAVYKTEIIEKYKSADDILKDKITLFENNLKDERKEEVKSFFVELVFAEDIDFLDFTQTGIEIKLSDSIKSYKDRIIAFINKVKDELALIDTQNHKAEILVEYKKTLNAAKAIKDVTDRKEAEKVEADKIKMAETNRRTALLSERAFVYHDITKTYNWVKDESVMITLAEVETFTKEKFASRLLEIDELIKPKEGFLEQAKKIDAPKVDVPVCPPPTEEIFTASFEVKGTYAQLTALGEYMKSNNITYKNIE